MGAGPARRSGLDRAVEQVGGSALLWCFGAAFERDDDPAVNVQLIVQTECF